MILVNGSASVGSVTLLAEDKRAVGLLVSSDCVHESELVLLLLIRMDFDNAGNGILRAWLVVVFELTSGRSVSMA
jgi:hypothetical protein